MPALEQPKSPLPVEVANTEPLKVEVAAVEAPPTPTPIKTTSGELTLPPTTTAQQDIASEGQRKAQADVSEGQRRINLLWETTQSRIAQMVVFTGVVLNSVVVIMVLVFDREITVNRLALISICLQFLNLTVGIVIGFYFSRVNHQAIGGVGPKPPEQPYTGR